MNTTQTQAKSDVVTLPVALTNIQKDDFSSLRQIPISELVEDPKNVRKVEPSAEGIAANIKSRGLIQNLVGRRLEDGSFAVVAGSRRRRALLKLVADGDLTDTDTVTCREVSEEEAVEISLSENIHREQMHPADQMIAWGNWQHRE